MNAILKNIYPNTAFIKVNKGLIQLLKTKNKAFANQISEFADLESAKNQGIIYDFC